MLTDKHIEVLNANFDSLNEEFGSILPLKSIADQSKLDVSVKDFPEVMDALARLESKLDQLIQMEQEEQSEESNEEKSLSLKEIIAAKSLKVTLSEDETHVKSTVEMKLARKSKKEDYYPTDSEMALINTNIRKDDAPKESGYVFELQAADDLEDRGLERFDRKALRKLAETAVKNQIPVLLAANGVWGDHEWLAKNARAVVFDAFEEKGKLIYKAYFPITESNKGVIEDIFAGLLSKLSVGFAMEYKDYECSYCKCPIISSKCTHQPGMKAENGETVLAVIKNITDNFEVSLVAVPMQAGTHIRRGQTKSLSEENPLTPILVIDSKSLIVNEDLAAANTPDGTITNDTIQDNRMSEEPKNDKPEDLAPASVDLKSVEDKIEALSNEVKTLSAKEVDNSAIENRLAEIEKSLATITDAIKAAVIETIAPVAKALEVVNENIAKVDDKVEKSATAPAVLTTKTYKEDTEQVPIVSLLSHLYKSKQ